MSNFLSVILSPFGLIYLCLTGVRNWLYNQNILKSTEFDIPIICVGNLSVGGSGKTPMVEYLIKHFADNYNIAVLSRGYGRKTTGFKWVEPDSLAIDVGDEPLQIKTKYAATKVAVCAKRVDGVIGILAKHPNVDLILLDDAYQHRAIKASIYLLLTTYAKPFFKDWIMPIGLLRERRNGAQRADAIIFTKCPKEHQKKDWNDKPIFYSSIKYSMPEVEGKVFGFSGLADNSIFKKKLKETYKLSGFKEFSDHYKFNKDDLETMKTLAQNATLICSEKDWTKIKNIEGSRGIEHVTIENKIEGATNFEEWLNTKLKNES